MKKTVITVALALALFNTAFADLVYTGITYTTQTAEQAAEGDRYNSNASFTFTLSDSYIGKSSTSGVWTTASTSGVTSFYEGDANALALTSITLWTTSHQTYPPYALVILDGDTVVAKAISVAQAKDDYILNGTMRDKWTWSFDPESSLLYKDKTYTVKYAGSAQTATPATSYTYPEDFDYSNYTTQGIIANNASDKIGTTSNSDSYQVGGMVLVTKAVNVPEPATVTLSLLALAGLAARRRRK